MKVEVFDIMMMKLLIAVSDTDYVEHLSRTLAEKYADTFEVYVCSGKDRLHSVLMDRKFDIALLEPGFVDEVGISQIKMPLILRGTDTYTGVLPANMERISKYQRISSIVGDILGMYAKVSPSADMDMGRARVTAVWSPAGGTGKTSAALAYAAQQVSKGKRAVYLSLQTFSDGAAFFPQTGKSISTIFGSGSGNIGLLAQSIRLQDQGSGILYFCDPTNYDDIYELTAEDVEHLIKGCTVGIDELIVDLSSEWNGKINKIFDMADSIIIVLDGKGRTKWYQFTSQNNIYGLIRDKITVAMNKGANMGKTGGEPVITLPYIQSEDPVVVYKTLSAYFA